MRRTWESENNYLERLDKEMSDRKSTAERLAVMFHAKGGWFFKRTEEGGVHIVKGVQYHNGAQITEEVCLDADSWASIVASVSARGETAETYKIAKGFHNA